jgi:hypothetical protein
MVFWIISDSVVYIDLVLAAIMCAQKSKKGILHWPLNLRWTPPTRVKDLYLLVVTRVTLNIDWLNRWPPYGHPGFIVKKLCRRFATRSATRRTATRSNTTLLKVAIPVVILILLAIISVVVGGVVWKDKAVVDTGTTKQAPNVTAKPIVKKAGLGAASGAGTSQVVASLSGSPISGIKLSPKLIAAVVVGLGLVAAVIATIVVLVKSGTLANGPVAEEDPHTNSATETTLDNNAGAEGVPFWMWIIIGVVSLGLSLYSGHLLLLHKLQKSCRDQPHSASKNNRPSLY